jgi:hypothetical protein
LRVFTVSSLDASSTANTSKGEIVWFKAEVTARKIVPARLCVGIITDIEGVVSILMCIFHDLYCLSQAQNRAQAHQ